MVHLNKYGEIEESSCPKCGKAIKPSWVACPECGNSLGNQNHSALKDTTGYSPKRKSKGLLWERIEVVTVFVLFVIISIVSFVFYEDIKEWAAKGNVGILLPAVCFLGVVTVIFMIVGLGLDNNGTDYGNKLTVLAGSLILGIGLLAWFRSPFFLFLLPLICLLLFVPET